MQPGAVKVVSERRRDLTGPWRGEQEGCGDSLSRHRGWGFPQGHWCREDTTLVE